MKRKKDMFCIGRENLSKLYKLQTFFVELDFRGYVFLVFILNIKIKELGYSK